MTHPQAEHSRMVSVLYETWKRFTNHPPQSQILEMGKALKHDDQDEVIKVLRKWQTVGNGVPKLAWIRGQLDGAELRKSEGPDDRVQLSAGYLARVKYGGVYAAGQQHRCSWIDNYSTRAGASEEDRWACYCEFVIGAFGGFVAKGFGVAEWDDGFYEDFTVIYKARGT